MISSLSPNNYPTVSQVNIHTLDIYCEINSKPISTLLIFIVKKILNLYQGCFLACVGIEKKDNKCGEW